MDPTHSPPRQPTLEIWLPADRFGWLAPVLAAGVTVAADLNCSMGDLLCRQLGIPEDYLNHRIQTVFMNGKAVDRIDEAIVAPDAVLALSASMPGLAGATLRKGGRYAAMRRAISLEAGQDAAAPTPGTVTLKLFNMIAREMGATVLKRGVRLEGRRLAELLADAGPSGAIQKARIDGRPVATADLARHPWPPGPVHLTVVTAQ